MDERDEPLEAFYGNDLLFEYRPTVTPAEAGPRAPDWRRSTATGVLLTCVVRGLQQVFEPERKERIVIEQGAPGEPDRAPPLELHLDPDSPRASFVVYRPRRAES
jgi:hypothetical protein